MLDIPEGVVISNNQINIDQKNAHRYATSLGVVNFLVKPQIADGRIISQIVDDDWLRIPINYECKQKILVIHHKINSDRQLNYTEKTKEYILRRHIDEMDRVIGGAPESVFQTPKYRTIFEDFFQHLEELFDSPIDAKRYAQILNAVDLIKLEESFELSPAKAQELLHNHNMAIIEQLIDTHYHEDLVVPSSAPSLPVEAKLATKEQITEYVANQQQCMRGSFEQASSSSRNSLNERHQFLSTNPSTSNVRER